MIKILVLTAFYPDNNGRRDRMFLHVRNRYYVRSGIDVTVLNFNTRHDYILDGVKVIPLSSYIKSPGQYDILVSHQSNIRNNYLFLKRFEKRFAHVVFFFHGHEILRLNKEYPAPYSFTKKGTVRAAFQDLYDTFKLSVWKRYYKKLSAKSDFVFVSRWILDKFSENLYPISSADINVHIINNSAGEVFEEEDYDWNCEKDYDFICIRADLDNAKYCVDLFVKLADLNPQDRFLLIGQGKFFEYNDRPGNLNWVDRTLDHQEMIRYINRSECAVMLTKEDTQGVMTCELATFGIPVITSDIEVCHEFFDKLPGVRMIINEIQSVDIDEAADSLKSGGPYSKCHVFGAANTVRKEVMLYRRLSGQESEE